MDEALSRARACILGSQTTEAGVLFGVDLLREEVEPERQADIQAALIDALAKTAPGSHARAFMIAVLKALDDTRGRV